MRDILDMDGWTLTDKRTEGNVVTFSADYLHEPRACEKCGSVSFYRHGTKTTTYVDSPLRARILAKYGESQIQATCESDSAPTVINGTTYLCLSAQQIERIRRSHRQET